MNLIFSITYNAINMYFILKIKFDLYFQGFKELIQGYIKLSITVELAKNKDFKN